MRTITITVVRKPGQPGPWFDDKRRPRVTSEGDLVGYLLDLSTPADQRPGGCVAESAVRLAVWEHYEDEHYYSVVSKGTPRKKDVREVHRILRPGGYFLLIGSQSGKELESLFEFLPSLEVDVETGAVTHKETDRPKKLTLQELFAQGRAQTGSSR